MSDMLAAASPAAESSVATPSETSAATSATPDAKTSTAESSTAEGAKTPSMFDAVKASLDKDRAEATPASETKSETKVADPQAEPEGEEDDAEDKGDLSEEEKKLLSAKTQKRIVKLARQRDDEKAVADRTRSMDRFMQTNGISREDAVGAFEVLSLIRTNPVEALNRLRTLSYNLSMQLGETLPKDIQDRVTAGTIDEATGKELALARAQAGGFKHATETLTAETREAQAQTVRQNITSAVNAWEKSVTPRDPDFASKKSLVETHFRALLQAGESLKTPEDAVRLMKKAYSSANEMFKAIRPQQRQEVRATTATPTAATKKAPTSMEEAIRQGLAA